MCIDMCVDMRIDMCVDMCVGMCIDMCIGPDGQPVQIARRDHTDHRWSNLRRGIQLWPL